MEEDSVENSQTIMYGQKIFSPRTNDSCQCSARKSDGDFCKTHFKEINKYCKICSKVKGYRVIHKYRWEINGRIDDTEYTECYKKHKKIN